MANQNTTTSVTFDPYYSEKTAIEIAEAKWFQQIDQTSHYWHKRLSLAQAGLRPLKPGEIPPNVEDHSFANVDQTLQRSFASLLQPLQTFQRTVKPKAIAVGYLLGISKIGQLLGAEKLASAAAGAALAPALLLAKHLHSQVQQQLYYLQAAQNPQALVENLLFHKVKGMVLQQMVSGATNLGRTIAYGLTPAAFDTNVRTPHPLAPEIEVISPVFRPTRALNKGLANRLAKRAGDIESKKGPNAYTVALRRKSNEFRKNKRRGGLWWLAFGLTLGLPLLLETLVEAGFTWLANKNLPLASMLKGYAGPVGRGLVSLRTVGYGAGSTIALNKLGIPSPTLNIPLPFTQIKIPLPVTAALGAPIGWYHQTVVNLASNYQPIRYDIFTGNTPQAILLREQLLPKSYAKIWGADYYNHPAAIDRYVNDYGRAKPWTATPRGLGSAQWEFMNAKWLETVPKPLQRAISTPARLYFKHPFIGGSISGFADGLVLGIVLGLPWQYTLALATGMGLISGLSTSPFLRNLKTYTLLGAGLGAEIGFLTGNNPWLFAGLGALVGTGTNLATNVGNLTNLYTSLQQAPPIGLFEEGGLMDPYWGLESPGYSRPVWIRTGIRRSLLSDPNWAEILQQEYPHLARNPIVKRIISWTGGSPKWGNFFHKLRFLRYAKGAFWGGGIGIQVALIAGFPWYVGLGVGAGLGIITQLAWEYVLTKVAAKVSDLLTNLSFAIGRVINIVSNIFIGAQYGSALYDWIQSWKEAFRTKSFSPIVQQFPKFILPAAGFGLSLIGALALIGTAPVWAAVALFALAGGLLAEAVVKLTYLLGIQTAYPSFISFLSDKLFRPAFSAVSQAGSALFGAMFGILGGFLTFITSRNLSEALQGIVMAAMGLAQLIGLSAGVIIPMLVASGFIITQGQIATIFGAQNFSSHKELVNKSSDLKSFTYQLDFSYLGDLLDTDGEEVQKVRLRILDSYISDILTIDNIEDFDFDNISDPSETVPGILNIPFYEHDVDFQIDNVYVSKGEKKVFEHTITFREPLNQILGENDVMCNRFSLIYLGPPTGHNITFQTLQSSNTICLDRNGEVVLPPSALFAQDLARCLSSDGVYKDMIDNYYAWCHPEKDPCTTQTYIDYVTRYDFSSSACDTANGGCPVPDANLVRLQTCLGYPINQNVINIIKGSTQTYDTFQCIGFVQAVEAQYGRILGGAKRACYYSRPADCVNNYHFYPKNVRDISEAEPGDMLIFGVPGCQNADGEVETGHIAYIVSKQENFFITAEGNIDDRGQTAVLSREIQGSSTLGFLRYEPGYSCP